MCERGKCRIEDRSRKKLDLQIAVVFMLGAREGDEFLVIFRNHHAVSATDGADEMSFSQQHGRPELQQKSNGAVFIMGLEAVKDENSKKLEELTAEQLVSGIVKTTGEKTGTADVTRPLPARSSADEEEDGPRMSWLSL